MNPVQRKAYQLKNSVTKKPHEAQGLNRRPEAHVCSVIKPEIKEFHKFGLFNQRRIQQRLEIALNEACAPLQGQILKKGEGKLRLLWRL